MPTGLRKKYTFIALVLFLPLAANAGSVDFGKVEQTRLDWNNDLRAEVGVAPYSIDTDLSLSAVRRSTAMQENGVVNHERRKGDGYYNYTRIQNRFAAQGITFKNVNRATFSESLGYGYYKCTQEECTDELIKAVKTTWEFFMKERDTKGLHYKALVHPYFQTMGLGITIDETTKKYYLTLHYASSVILKR